MTPDIFALRDAARLADHESPALRNRAIAPEPEWSAPPARVIETAARLLAETAVSPAMPCQATPSPAGPRPAAPRQSEPSTRVINPGRLSAGDLARLYIAVARSIRAERSR